LGGRCDAEAAVAVFSTIISGSFSGIIIISIIVVSTKRIRISIVRRVASS
jgi:hypothetical protein